MAIVILLARHITQNQGKSLDASRLSGRLPTEIETLLYRVFQEALTNAMRHAHARNVLICLEQAGGYFCGDITDDGNVSSADPLAAYYATKQPYNKFDDLNGDGVPDLIVANSGSNNVLVYPGLGDGQRPNHAQPDRQPAACRHRLRVDLAMTWPVYQTEARPDATDHVRRQPGHDHARNQGTGHQPDHSARSLRSSRCRCSRHSEKNCW